MNWERTNLRTHLIERLKFYCPDFQCITNFSWREISEWMLIGSTSIRQLEAELEKHGMSLKPCQPKKQNYKYRRINRLKRRRKNVKSKIC